MGWGRNDGIAFSAGMLHLYGPDNPEGAAHQFQLFGGIFILVAQRIATVRATRLPLVAFAFLHGEVIQGTVCRYGADTTGGAWPCHPPDR